MIQRWTQHQRTTALFSDRFRAVAAWSGQLQSGGLAAIAVTKLANIRAGTCLICQLLQW
jgi:hypothetical protein